jgi:hypothetical protein
MKVVKAKGTIAKDNPDEVETEFTCRIWYIETYTADDPLISVCSWSGSWAFIHINCLKQWLATKLQKREESHVLSYHWSNLRCELWKDMFPVAVEFNGDRHEILEVPTPDAGFFVFETIPKTFTDSRSFHAISMKHSERLTIGRGTSCDIRISDISVSRVHSTLKLKNGHLVIKDNWSKFGTLVQAARPLVILPRQMI